MLNFKKSLLLVSLLGLVVSVEAKKKDKEQNGQHCVSVKCKKHENSNPLNDSKKKKTPEERAAKRKEAKARKAAMTPEQKAAKKLERQGKQKAKLDAMTPDQKATYAQKKADSKAQRAARKAAKKAAAETNNNAEQKPFDPYRELTDSL